MSGESIKRTSTIYHAVYGIVSAASDANDADDRHVAVSELGILYFYHDFLCSVLGTTTQELMGNSDEEGAKREELPTSFDNAAEAMAFMLKMPILAAYGGYDVKNMSDETIIEFANEILGQLKLVSYKYR